jgi:hypothetical protein
MFLFNWKNGLDGNGGPIYFLPIKQGSCGSEVWYEPNRSGAGMPLGEWSLAEFYIRLNTPGQADGIIRVWVNGQLTHEYTNVNCRSSGSTATMTYASSDFYQNGWSGGPYAWSQSLPASVWSWDMDHFFVAGR